MNQDLSYISRPYDEQETLLKDFNQYVEYRKTIEFFIKTKGLHGYFKRNGGSLEKAVANANRSMDEKLKGVETILTQSLEGL